VAKALYVVGLSVFLLLTVLLLVNWDSLQTGFYRWQPKAAGEAMFAPPDASTLAAGWFPGAGDARTRYSRARQALLELDYPRELVLRFPEGSNWNGLLQQCRKRFPDGGWEMWFGDPRVALRLTVPSEQIAAWKGLVAEFSAP